MGQVTYLFEPRVESCLQAAVPMVWLPTGGLLMQVEEHKPEQQEGVVDEDEEAALQMMGGEFWMA